MAAARREGRAHRHARPAGDAACCRLCFGAATKFSQLHLDADKTYEACAARRQDVTGDAEGEVIAERPVDVHADDLARVEARFTGAFAQVPPMHSALKKDGKALYEYAREGIEVERAARDVTIYRLALARASGSAEHRASRPRSARAPTSARWARTSARRWAAAPT